MTTKAKPVTPPCGHTYFRTEAFTYNGKVQHCRCKECGKPFKHFNN